MADDIAIKVEHVSKDFVLPHEKVNSVKSLFTSMAKGKSRGKETQHALHDISFEIKKGEFFGIVGRNGSGKSTLLKILAGIYQPTTGKTHTEGKLVPFIELGVGFNPELTGRENVFLNGAMLGFSENEVAAMYDDIVSFAELGRFMDQKLKNYSSGMQVRLAFSMAIRAQADILLIDEVLAVGDADFQRKCFDYFDYLKRTKTTVVLVSHDMEAIRQYCTRAVLISDSQLVEEGDADKVSQAYTKLFTKKNESTAFQDEELRWGDGSMNIEKITVDVKSDKIVIHETLLANKDVDGCVAGFRVTSATDAHVTGTNTKLEKQTIGKLAKGKRVKLTWSVPNIFSDGTYFIDPTIHNTTTTEVYDWWEKAAKFHVQKDRQLPFYAVDPTFELIINESS